MCSLADHEQQLIAAAGFQEEEDEDEEEDEEEKEELTPGQIKRKAAYQMLLGAALVAFVADPMVRTNSSKGTQCSYQVNTVFLSWKCPCRLCC
jgi:hypothetical protein